MNKDNLIRIYQVDAFTDELFRGNPAVVCLLNKEFDDNTLQAIAAEMNLSETAFLLSLEDRPIKEITKFSLRWFTPEVEVPLCGHATLATAAVLFFRLNILASEVIFETKSGELTAKKLENGICLNFPVDKPETISPPEELIKATGVTDFTDVVYAKNGKKLLIRLQNEEDVKNLEPNFELMKKVNSNVDIKGVIVTSTGSPLFDFISRYFGPWVGVNEDPVTGAAHTVLAPYWSKILGKQKMTAFQVSKRGGQLIVRLVSNNRVDLIGKAVTVFFGKLLL